MIKSWPLLIRLTFILLLLFLVLYALYIAQGIFVPLGFSLLLAILLQPIQFKCMRFKIPRIPAIMIAMLVAAIVLTGILVFMYYQVSTFVNDFGTVKKNLLQFFSQVQDWFSSTFNVSKQKQQQLIEQTKENSVEKVGAVAGIIGASFASVVVVPVYVFLFMYYSDHLKHFIVNLFDQKHLTKVTHALQEVRTVIQHYITGLLLETTCVAVLNSIGLMIIGVPFAILLGVIGAILNLIPYIGGLISVVLTALITLTNTGDAYKMLGSFIVYLIVQFIDNNFFVPRIIGSHVKLNALISLIAVLVGGAIAGVGGMFLSIPFIAIAKVVFDHVEDLKPWGTLFGDEENAGWNLRLARRKARAIQANKKDK
ncbi:AI-2E family transporter [Danxiaibacter flavus]|uniref:AI-2E family transporter n=1 Tax=Danxiaibacter flavus TaxID=3049108 RepID=A0ABV3ZH02_9BACT|nr:AI-2E family transporter [Chitinophagaceae bacterium DXS]